MVRQLALNEMVDVLKAVAETTRLRILFLLDKGDLTVSDLTKILGQSQPRVSRHLRLLTEANLIERYQEGAWAYFSLSSCSLRREMLNTVLEHIDRRDNFIEGDMARLDEVKKERSRAAAAYFSKNAHDWDKLRLLHVPDNTVEQTMVELVGTTPFQSMLDIGTGTGSLLKLFSPLYTRAIGIDNNRDMLAVARVNLDKAGISNAQVRLGDVANLPVENETFNLVTIYQVLHFLSDPESAIFEAARVMRPGARLIIVDYAPHELEYLREKYAHIRMGFSDSQMEDWLDKAGLILEKTLSFQPQQNGNTKGLTIKLWLARDTRLLIA
ncbi:transcriptional regulator, ArsR family [Bartonella apihabitans]|uniref:Transcriptional regulator, ArsR family n=1 Tax=Bartonella apihabitans TaxID=2750929 RepID=A0A1U9MCG1_9HYPH|nr:metalloregulator ArsR/SmtB family transcription factor [Bartonella apihabitans]AQT42994.1 transcriptional regulator, ArsR family [Bartonella apihabitans]